MSTRHWRDVEYPAQLEEQRDQARDIAIQLEQQNEALIEFIRPIAGRGCLYKKSGGCDNCPSCRALALLKRCSAVLS